MVAKAVGVVSVLVLALLGCQDDDSPGAIEAIESNAVTVSAEPPAAQPPAQPGASTPTPTTKPEAEDQTPSFTADCAVGTYTMVSPEFWVNVAQAGGEGGSGVTLGGDPFLTLDAEGSASVAFDSWQFRLSFPDSSDTVKGTQNGTVTGTWARDDNDAVSLSTTGDSVAVSFLLETAQGAVPVPSGGSLSPGVGTFAVSADCATGRLELQAAGFLWPFQRR